MVRKCVALFAERQSKILIIFSGPELDVCSTQVHHVYKPTPEVTLCMLVFHFILFVFQGLLDGLSQQGVDFFQVPSMPPAVRALIEEDVLQMVTAKKASIREQLQAEQDALVEEKRKEREACIEARRLAEEALQQAEREAEEQKKAGKKGRESRAGKAEGKGKDGKGNGKKKEADTEDREANLPVVPEPFVPPEIVVPTLSADTIQQFKKSSENYQNWLFYL